MVRNAVSLVLVALLIAAVLPVYAQGVDGWTTYRINMRSGAGTRHPVMTTLIEGTELVLEARNADLSWLLVHTLDGGYRGWVSALYVGLRDGYGSLANLPVSDEVVSSQPAAPPAPNAAPAGESQPGQGSAAPVGAESAIAVLMSQPIVPAIGGNTGSIFRTGLAMGNRPDVFTIVGGCNSLARAFMQPFGSGSYNLGAYGYLQPTIDYFLQTSVDGLSNSFFHKGVAVRAGYTASAVNDPAWADPAYCQMGESPLTCEYRRSRPAVAFVMLGVLDVYWYTPAQYEASVRQIIETSIQQGVIPVITTFPTTTGHTGDAAGDYEGVVGFDDRALYRAQFNLILVNLAREYGVPLMNLWRAAQALPRSGFREGDFIHFWEPEDASQWGSLSGAQNQNIFAMWNLIALQTLDALRANTLRG